MSRALAGAIADPGAINAIGNSNGICQAAEADTTTAAAYEDLGTPLSSFTFVKLSTATAIKVEMTITCFCSVATGTVVRFGVQINGSDYDVAQFYFNNTGEHLQVAGVRRIPGIPAGTYTVQPRWYRQAGTGTLATDTSDWLTVHATEVQ